MLLSLKCDSCLVSFIARSSSSFNPLRLVKSILGFLIPLKAVVFEKLDYEKSVGMFWCWTTHFDTDCVCNLHTSQFGFVGSPLKSSAHYFAATFSVVFWYPFGEQHVLPLLAVVLQFDRCLVAISLMTCPHRFVAWLSSVWILLLEFWPLQAAHEIVPTIFAY